MRKWTIYVNGMTIGTVQDERYVGEADAIVASLRKSFVGTVQESQPFKDESHRTLSLFPADSTHADFLNGNPTSVPGRTERRHNPA